MARERRRPDPRRRRRDGVDRRHLAVPRPVDRRPRDPGGHQQPGQPRRHGGRDRRPAAAAVARRARPLAARRVDRRAPARRAAPPARRGGHDLERALPPAGLGAPSRGHDRAPPRGPADGGDRPPRRAAVPDHASDSRGSGSTAGSAARRRSRRSTAPSWSPRPTSTWGCCPAGGRRAGTTPGGSGAATASSSSRRSRSAARSRCAEAPRRRRGSLATRGRTTSARPRSATNGSLRRERLGRVARGEDAHRALGLRVAEGADLRATFPPVELVDVRAVAVHCSGAFDADVVGRTRRTATYLNARSGRVALGSPCAPLCRLDLAVLRRRGAARARRAGAG